MSAVPAWEESLNATRVDLEKLGQVNLAAIDELKESSERKEYLDRQYADVTSALTTLEEAMHKIDKETRTRFEDTFNRINDGLKDKFPKLFGGGHAYLELVGEDVLSAGVAVMARPPGKRNSSIHQLSGGEKALTAVALVFSIFDLNPAPFCLLDEVDAPLDEHNVGRFCDIVKLMSERVQFIFITHNKATMELAQQFMGVTMTEPGCSRLVSVDVDEAVRMATGVGRRCPSCASSSSSSACCSSPRSRDSNGGAHAGTGRWPSRATRRSHDAPAPRTPAALPEISVTREPRSTVPDTLPVIELRKAERVGARDSGGIAVSHDVAVDEPFENTSTQAIFRAHDEPYVGEDDEVSDVRTYEYENPAADGPKVVLDWPGEAERRIVTLRVLPKTEPRFAGRSLRQAFGSAGFWHGPLDIYHLADSEGRVIISAAALAQPGTFDPSIMDSQRFSGTQPVRGVARTAARARSLR